MWHNIEQIITTETDQAFSIEHKTSITGGCISQAYKISNHAADYFVKINNKEHINHFESEAYALMKIASQNEITCPDVIGYGVSNHNSFLILNYLNLEKSNTVINAINKRSNWYVLGNKLALMHKNATHNKFGWQEDNYIGDTVQPNLWNKDWSTFFAEQRIAWQLELLHDKSVNLGNIDHITETCQRILQNHHTKPSLVHGDLWLGNLGFIGSSAVIFDPACYYGDREVDIAMTELFGYLPQDFYQGYQDTYPLQPGFEQRKIVYNFYHILNHANLFAGHYTDQARAVLSRIMSLTVH